LKLDINTELNKETETNEAKRYSYASKIVHALSLICTFSTVESYQAKRYTIAYARVAPAKMHTGMSKGNIIFKLKTMKFDQGHKFGARRMPNFTKMY
jgi:hypothetical protein